MRTGRIHSLQLPPIDSLFASRDLSNQQAPHLSTQNTQSVLNSQSIFPSILKEEKYPKQISHIQQQKIFSYTFHIPVGSSSDIPEPQMHFYDNNINQAEIKPGLNQSQQFVQDGTLLSIPSHKNSFIKVGSNNESGMLNEKSRIDSVSIESQNSPVCRVCLISLKDEGLTIEQANMLSLCQCRGSIQYIHFECLKNNLELRFGKTAEMANNINPENVERDPRLVREQRKQRVRKAGLKEHACELCQTTYKVKWASKHIKRNSTIIKQKKKCYLFSSILSFLLLIACLYGVGTFAIQNGSSNSSKIEDVMMSLMGMVLLTFGGIINLLIFIFFASKTFWVKIFIIEEIISIPHLDNSSNVIHLKKNDRSIEHP